MCRANEIWHCHSEADWRVLLDEYWCVVKPVNIEIERAVERFRLAEVENLDAEGWYNFLLETYFRWKYTARNRYGSTTKHLKRYAKDGSLADLYGIKQNLLAFDLNDIERGLKLATSIRGLGTAGASGLLSVFLPTHFATVDQFVVKALRQVDDLPQIEAVRKLNPEGLTVRAGVLLIQIMRAKAAENNLLFGTDFWTPRRIDMALWTLGH